MKRTKQPTPRAARTRMSTDKILEQLFVVLIGCSCIGGGCCGDEEPYTYAVPRLPPANPGGAAAPAFDPKTVTDAECELLCEGGFDTCEAAMIEGTIPAVLCTEYPQCDAGRRPAGLDVTAAATSHDAAATWLANAAHLEAASVLAFETLARELADLGAPRRLVARARRAAVEEERHARIVGGLARRRGAVPPAVRVARASRRSIVRIAIENAVEGCVRETFAALVACHQAASARARDVRRSMKAIARDETSHAALAWDVHAWILGALTPDERRRVERARKREARRLAATWGSPPAARDALGLPASDRGRALAAALADRLEALRA